MNLRVAFDIDGVFADFASAYREIRGRLFGAKESEAGGEHKDQRGPLAVTNSSVRRNTKWKRHTEDVVWEVIRSTPDFWTGVKPIEPNAIRRLHTLTMEHHWEVLFITQRPETLGDTVQRQTQRWLHDQGVDMPSVLVLNGSRGRVAASLELDYYVDDDAANCVDLTSDSRARPILIVDDDDATTLASARRLGIATARNIDIALDILDHASAARPQPNVLQQLAQLVGWK